MIKGKGAKRFGPAVCYERNTLYIKNGVMNIRTLYISCTTLAPVMPTLVSCRKIGV